VTGQRADTASRRAVLAILVLISMVGPLSLNIAMPVLPLIQQSFATTRENATLVLSLFLGAMAVSQLVLGPLADRLGRRPVLVGGLAIFVVSSTAAAFAEAIGQLLLARVIQSLGATVGLPLARTIIRDLYDRDASASMIGYVTMAMVVAPMLSPMVGAVAADQYGWPAIFWICAALGVVALAAVVLAMPETRPAALDTATTREVAIRSVALLNRVRFVGYAGTAACASAIFFAFQAGAPFLVIDVMGWGKLSYGAWFVVAALAYMLGNFAAGRFSQRAGVARMIAVGNWGGFAGAALCLALALIPVMHPWALFVPMAVVAFFNGLVIPNAIAGAVSVDVNAAGAASGLAGFLQSGLSAIASFVVGAVVTEATAPVGFAMTLIAIVGLVFGYLAERR
jgi:DHA1 family bicyclomycin/chloramphenicol resistance-like MFS transporter